MRNTLLEIPGTLRGFDRPWSIYATRGCESVSSGCETCVWRYVHENQRRRSGLNGFDDVIENPRSLWTIRKRVKPTWYVLSPRSDLFQTKISDKYLIEVFKLIANKKQHLFQVTTKYVHRMKDFLDNVLPEEIAVECDNLMIGVNIEAQECAWRIYELNVWRYAKIVELAPIIGPVTDLDLSVIDWVTISTHYNPKINRVRISWILDVVDMARSLNVPVAVDFISMGAGIERYPSIGGRRLMGKPDIYLKWRLKNESEWLKRKRKTTKRRSR